MLKVNYFFFFFFLGNVSKNFPNVLFSLKNLSSKIYKDSHLIASTLLSSSSQISFRALPFNHFSIFLLDLIIMACVKIDTHMRGNEVGNEIKAKTPPNGAKNVACDFLHSPHESNAVIHLGEVLEQED